MNPTANYIISFPRSGHHYTFSLINIICRTDKIPISYCEYYHCCKQTPCKYNKIIQKNHDIDLQFAIQPDHKYIVLYRANYIQQMEAYFRYRCESNPKMCPLPDDYSHTQYLDLLNQFIENNHQYYKQFINKWVINNHQNILKIDYDNIINDCQINISKMLKHFFPNETPRQQTIDQIIKNNPPQKLHNFQI